MRRKKDLGGKRGSGKRKALHIQNKNRKILPEIKRKTFLGKKRNSGGKSLKKKERKRSIRG